MVGNNFSQFYGFCSLMEWTEEQRLGAIRSVSFDRTASIKELNPKELQQLTNAVKEAEAKLNGGMRGKIIYYLVNCGYVLGDGMPDWAKINHYVANHGGTGNSKKKDLHKLKNSELRKVLLVVQQFHKTKFPNLQEEALKKQRA